MVGARGVSRVAALTAVAAGAAVWIRRAVLPAPPDHASSLAPRRMPDPDARPSPDGTGVRIVVNPSSGPALVRPPTDALREALPGADVVELGPDDDLVELLCVEGLTAIGAAGGDGTLATAATIAADRDLPLVAVPGGTLNHLARDLGLDSVDDAVAGIRSGTVVHMDLGVAGDHRFVNTLTFGGYTQVVDTRERLEARIGKWPALLVALVRELPRMEPVAVEIDGRPMRVWLAWIGNCRYDPPGFGPVWRPLLDDGLLDLRIVAGHHQFSRTRFVLAVLAGRLRHCSVYEERAVEALHIRSLEGPLRLAADGETFDGPAELDVTKQRRALQVTVPPAVPLDGADGPATGRR